MNERHRVAASDWPSAAVAISAILFLAAVAVISIKSYTVEDALRIWAAVSAVLGPVAGALVTYFFTSNAVQQINRERQIAYGAFAEAWCVLKPSQKTNIRDLGWLRESLYAVKLLSAVSGAAAPDSRRVAVRR